MNEYRINDVKVWHKQYTCMHIETIINLVISVDYTIGCHLALSKQKLVDRFNNISEGFLGWGGNTEYLHLLNIWAGVAHWHRRLSSSWNNHTRERAELQQWLSVALTWFNFQGVRLLIVTAPHHGLCRWECDKWRASALDVSVKVLALTELVHY